MRHRDGTRRLVALAAVLCLPMLGATSCVVPIQAVRPPVPVPASFSAAGAAPRQEKWWTAFRDPTLDRLIEQAVQDNLDLRVAWDRLAQARAVARRAGAPLYPSLTGEASVVRTRTVQHIQVAVPATDTGPAGTAAAPGAAAVEPVEPATRTHKETSYSSDLALGLTASYELDVWGRIRASRDAAALAARASREDVVATAITVAAGVATTWYRLADQRGQLELLDEQIETNEKFLQSLRARFGGAGGAAADVLQQEQLLEATRAEKLAAEAQRDVLRHQLAILLGRPPRAAPADARDLPSLPPLPHTGLPAALVQQRPDVRGAFLRLQAAHHDVAAAVADRFPRLSLSARAETSDPDTHNLFKNWIASLGANLTAPLFDGHLRAAEVQRTRAVASERLHAYGQEILRAFAEVEDALVQERQQAQFLEKLGRQVELARGAAELTLDRYVRAGGDFLRMLTARQSYQTLQRRHLQAQRELIEFRINLYRALGGGWDLKRPTPAPPSGDDGRRPT